MRPRPMLALALLALLGCDAVEAPPAPEPGWFDHPQALAFVDGMLVVANSGYRRDGWAPGSLTVVDPATGARVARVATRALNPQALVVDGEALYVVETGALDLSDDRPRVGSVGAIERFEVEALRAGGAASAVWPMPALPDDDRVGAPVDLAIGGDRAVVGSALANVVWVLDLARGDWSRGPADPVWLGETYALGLGAVRAWAEGFVVVDYNADAVTLLDRAGRPAGCTAEVGAVPGELEGAGSPVVDGETLYVVLSQAGRLIAVDLRALADDCRVEARTVVSGLGSVPNDLRLHGDRLYVVHSGDNTVVAYGLDGREAARWVLPVASNPWHVAIEGRWMAISAWAAHAVTLVDLDTGAVRTLTGAPLPPVEAPADQPGEVLGGEPAPADVVVEAQPIDLDAPTGDPARAINGVRGGGEGAGSVDVYTLGLEPGDRLVLGWSGRRVIDGPGADFVVFENAFRHPGGVFVDPVIVELSRDGATWVSWPHDYLGPDGVFVDDPAAWAGFAGLAPVGLHVDAPVDPFSAAAGGDRFDLAALPDDGEAGQIKREGFVHLRLVSAASRVDPDTGERFVRDRVSDGADVDGVFARYFDRIDP